MTKKEFNILLPIKLQELLALIGEKEQFDFFTALHYLYESELYNAISNEDTKVWHLSNEKLYEMLKNEKIYGGVRFPDYV